jgi:hypothetical protein
MFPLRPGALGPGSTAAPCCHSLSDRHPLPRAMPASEAMCATGTVLSDVAFMAPASRWCPEKRPRTAVESPRILLRLGGPPGGSTGGRTDRLRTTGLAFLISASNSPHAPYRVGSGASLRQRR